MRQNQFGEFICYDCDRGLDAETRVRLVMTDDDDIQPLCWDCARIRRSRAANVLRATVTGGTPAFHSEN
jgi:hypothetical protein